MVVEILQSLKTCFKGYEDASVALRIYLFCTMKQCVQTFCENLIVMHRKITRESRNNDEKP